MGESWSATRQAIVDGGKSIEEAIEILERSWREQHEKNIEAWDEFQRRRQPSPDQNRDQEGDQPIIPPGDGTHSEDEPPQWLNEPTPSFLDIQPARHILKRLEKREYVEIWHFTAQGCRDTAVVDLTTPDDTFGIINTERGLMLQTVGASSTSGKATKDEHLSWEQLTEGKGRLLECMGTGGWSAYEVTELAKFFFKLDMHPIRSQDYGTQTVLRYQDRVRQDWVRRLRAGRPFAIGMINDTLMGEFQRQIGMEIQAKNNRLQSEVIRKQEDFLNRGSQRSNPRNQDARTRRARPSRSRSLVRRPNNRCQRSWSPEEGRRSTFRAPASGSDRRDRLSACPICLGRHRHHTASCQATETWNGRKTICSRGTGGRIINGQGRAICSDWQRPKPCSDTSGKHIHECSGCGSSEHGADACPSAQA